MSEEIKEGDKILCLECNGIVYVAKKDIPFRGLLLSEDFSFEDGSEVPFRSAMKCPHCGAIFNVIQDKKTGNCFWPCP